MEEVTYPFVMVVYCVWRKEEPKNSRGEEREPNNRLQNRKSLNAIQAPW